MRPLIFGEVLFDCFPDGRQNLGGAPFNVAWNLAGIGLDPLLISRVGQDAQGEKIIKKMAHWGLDTRGIQIDPHRSTGQVIVSLSAGQPSYQIADQVAYDAIAYQPIADLLANEDYLLYYGSLASRHEESRQTLKELRNNRQQLKFVDINLRKPWWQKDLVHSLLESATWVKLNHEELAMIMQIEINSQNIQQRASQLRDDYNWQILVVTMGAEGALVITPEEYMYVEAGTIEKLEDTVGAGDAFSSIIIYGLLSGANLQKTIEFAAFYAASICSIQGAITDNLAFYSSIMKQWK